MRLILFGSRKFDNYDWNNRTAKFHIPQLPSSDSMTFTNKHVLLFVSFYINFIQNNHFKI